MHVVKQMNLCKNDSINYREMHFGLPLEAGAIANNGIFWLVLRAVERKEIKEKKSDINRIRKHKEKNTFRKWKNSYNHKWHKTSKYKFEMKKLINKEKRKQTTTYFQMFAQITLHYAFFADHCPSCCLSTTNTLTTTKSHTQK